MGMLFLCRHVSSYVSDEQKMASQKSPPLRKHSVPKSVRAADEEDKDENTEAQVPNAAERAMGLLGPWNTIKSWINLVRLLLKPPSSNMDMETPTSTGAMMKDAATKSFETSKSTAEDVAMAAGDAVHRTVEKAKRTVSNSEQNPSANEDL